ncbi:hypothetical protein ACFQ0G_09535 [Streptomyces chiangmaiensis]
MGHERSDSEVPASTRADSEATEGEADEGRLSHLLGGLLIELGRKVQRAGIEGVRILSAEEVDAIRLNWFRMGWEERARADDPAAVHRAAGTATAREQPHPVSHPADTDTRYAVTPMRLVPFLQHTRDPVPEPRAPGKSAARPQPAVRAREGASMTGCRTGRIPDTRA